MFEAIGSLMETSPIFGGALLLIFLVLIVWFGNSLLRAPKDRIHEYHIPTIDEVPGQQEELDFIGHMNRGNELLGEYSYDKALHHFHAALKLKPSDTAVHFKMGRVYLQKEDPKNAIAAFRNVLSLNPQQIEASYELARLFMLQGHMSEAHKEIAQALTVEPTNEELLKLQVKLLEMEEKYREALPVLKRLMESVPVRSVLKYRLQHADFLIKIAQYADALSELELMLNTDPDNEFLYRTRMGQAYFEMGNFTKAIEYFKTLLQQQEKFNKEPDLLQLMKNRMAAALCNEGVKYFQAGDVPASIQRYDEALTYDAFNPDIQYNLGKAYARQKDAAKAMKHYEKAIELSPTDVGSIYELAVLQDEKGMVEPAIENYEKVLSLDSAHLNSVFGLGTLYGVQGDLEKSIRYLGEAVKLNPEYVDAIYNLGVALERQNQPGKAVQMYKRVLVLEPEHEKARSNLAHIKHQQSQAL